jgi:tRNA (guanine26-N2/guanine27-N2)-dimethyltransferase
VFYNPAMARDRDLAVAFVRAWAVGAPRERDGWEALAATGVRGLRLLNETVAFRSMYLTEANPDAADLLQRNAARFSGAVAERRDIRAGVGRTFDYVDLDPYGSPLPFLDAALEAVRPGGVLAVTATDMMVLAGVQPGASVRLYGARPVRGRLAPEGALRILVGGVARRADTVAQRPVRPLLAYSRDHYVRAFLEVGAPGGPSTTGSIAVIDPSTWHGPDLGPGGPFGPMWMGPMLDPAVVGRLEVPPTAADPRATAGFLERLRGELEADVPFYYEANSLASHLGLAEPPNLAGLISELRAAGHRVARAHSRPEAVRTDGDRASVEAAARRVADQSQNARVRA